MNPEYLLEEGLVAIKDYSENTGILAALEAAERTGAILPLAYTHVHICRLLID